MPEGTEMSATGVLRSREIFINFAVWKLSEQLMKDEKLLNDEIRRQAESLASGKDLREGTAEAPYGTRGGRVCRVRPDVMTVDDIVSAVPRLGNHRKLVERLMRMLWLDKVNHVHGKYCYEEGIPFSHLLVEDQFRIKLRIDGEENLARFAEGPFITVSNHPFGALDGILLLHIVGTYREDFRVMVNMILNYLSAMRPSFIAVDPSKSDDPAKRRATMQGIKEAMRHIRDGHPMGFFPAGAVAKVSRDLRIRDREWQPSVIRLINQMKVPVIPIYFHGHNGTFFNILGMIDWRLRTLRLPRELFNKTGQEVLVSIGKPIMPERQAEFTDLESFGKFLRESTDRLRSIK